MSPQESSRTAGPIGDFEWNATAARSLADRQGATSVCSVGKRVEGAAGGPRMGDTNVLCGRFSEEIDEAAL